MEMGITCIYLAISSVLLFSESYCLSFSLNILDNNTNAEHTPYGKNEISVMILFVNERKKVIIRHKYNNHTEAYLLLYGCVSSAFRLNASLKSLFLDCQVNVQESDVLSQVFTLFFLFPIRKAALKPFFKLRKGYFAG